MPQEQARIVNSQRELQEYGVLELEAPLIAAEAQPGQFVHIRVCGQWDPLLRRPLSIMLAEKHTGRLRLLIKRVGRGTEILAQLPAGACLDVLGPLGRSFPLPATGRDVLLVAGGVGVAPLIFFADVLQTAAQAYRVRGLYGGASEQHLPLWAEFAGRCEEFYLATEDGSCGEKGLVTDLLPAQLARQDVQAIYTCGPRPMMAKVAALAAEYQLPCYVSLEQWMGCGVGACMGCVVPATPIASQAQGAAYLRVCTDGPVFEANAIDWKRLLEEKAL